MLSESGDCEISVVTPVYNEIENIPTLFERINKALSDFGRKFEIIIVNDGSNDGSEKVLTDMCRKHKHLKVVNLFRNKGKGAALELGFSFASGKYIVNIDGDLQCHPEDISKLILELEKGFDVVSGQRVDRLDTKSVIITSKAFNILVRRLTSLHLKDYFSGLKCYRRQVVKFLDLYGDLYRFALVYAHKEGFRVTEIPISHSPRFRGSSKYRSLSRLQIALADILTLLFTVTFNQERVYHIGLVGLFLLSIGVSLYALPFFIPLISQAGFMRCIEVFQTIFLFLGAQVMIFKSLSNSFFHRHQEERIIRKRNIKNIEN